MHGQFPDISPTRVSARVPDAIKELEGFSDTAYLDVAGVWTIGYGQAVGVKQGQSISEEQASALLLLRITEFEKNVTDAVTVPLTQGMFDALVDFTYNEGNTHLLGSTLLRKLNAGDYKGAWCEFPNWDFVHGRQMPGLLKRRMVEQAWFKEGMEL